MLFIQSRERLASGGCMYVLLSIESDLAYSETLLGAQGLRRD
jgi:hypothetical protein